MTIPAITVDREQLKKAIFEQNSLHPKDGVFMMKNGEVKCAYRGDEGVACELISGVELGRMLAADALFSYSESELAKWVDGMDLTPLQAKLNASGNDSSQPCFSLG